MDDDARSPRRGVSSKGLEVSELTLDPSRRTAGTLHVVATPVGHLDDVTLRAIRVLREVDLVACEDTRQTAKLLRAHGIATPTTSYFEHNEKWKGEKILDLVRGGRSAALVSDAGTPGISDPGFRLVRDARAEGLAVVPVPGAVWLTFGASDSMNSPLHRQKSREQARDATPEGLSVDCLDDGTRTVRLMGHDTW